MLKFCLGLAMAALALAPRTYAAEGEEPAAEAEEPAPRLPLARAERPLTLPQGVLEPLARFSVVSEPPRLFDLGFGAAAGITDDLELRVVVAPLQIAPSLIYGQVGHPGPSVGATFRLYGQRTQLGFSADATFITLPHSAGAVVDLGLPIHSRSGDRVRLDYGVFARVTQSQDKTVVASVPFSLAVDLVPELHFGASTGVVVSPDAASLPLGFFAGYTIGGADGPLFEIDPYFRLPGFLSTAPSDDRYEAGVTLRAFLYL